MIPALSFHNVIEHIKETKKPLSCILFAPIFDNIGQKEVIPRLGYLNSRTGENIHFYCVGYGAFWNTESVPDMELLNESPSNKREEPWAFSQKKFADFIDEIEEFTSWKYSGGTELLILNSEADFSNVLSFNIDEMISDGVIRRSNTLFETLIQISKKESKSIDGVSLKYLGKASAEVIFDSLMELLPKPIKSLKNVWTKGKHYALNNISK